MNIKNILIENMFGHKTYYNVNVEKEDDEGKTLIIDHFTGKKLLKYDSNKLCFIVKKEFF